MHSPELSPHLISVIIPCYNHAHYLANAIDSVLAQSHQPVEIIVVDDGSTDNTKGIAESYPHVIYIYQSNAGLSAARNTGMENSKASYLLFLDADDWLLPDALSINLHYLQQHTEVAFVSGAYTLVYEPKNQVWDVKKEFTENHYCHLLESNYIGMHATVLYQRWVFDHFRYDTSLKACEDYDLYLNVARRFSIAHHTSLIAVYRIHTANMSSNFVLLLHSALTVLERQAGNLYNDKEKQCFQNGKAFWKKYYTEKIYNQLLFEFYEEGKAPDKKALLALKDHNQVLYYKFINERSTVLKKGG